jgi:hypothetical protein
VIGIVRQLVEHPHTNEDDNGHPYCEPKDIDGRISAVTLKVSDGNPEKIDKHCCLR